MAFDIYGERLTRGHCEVHPYVHEEYPCSVCVAESRRKHERRREEERQRREMEDAYYAQMRGDMEYESWLTK